ncbi:MAG: hypothetical protein WAW10_03050 [Gallionella sp.]
MSYEEANGGLRKFRVRPNARRGKNFAVPHMGNMQARNFSRNAAVGMKSEFYEASI